MKLPLNNSDEVLRMYHGAPQESANSILKNGLLKRHSKWKPRRIFLTTNFNMATKFGGYQHVDQKHPEPYQTLCSDHDSDCNVYDVSVTIFEIAISRKELHQDRNLEFRHHPNSSVFYIKRDILPSEIKNVKNVRIKITMVVPPPDWA